MGVLSNLEPEAVFRYFEKICSIPHGSGNTNKISNFCVSFAKEHGLKYQKDSHNNVIIWKDGSPGYENSPAVMLQGHLDMVCEKETDCKFDFEKYGLNLQLKDGFVSAKGTTLGGDDGIAIAYALAILESDSIPHPPLEAVFTTDEEIGMTGAAAIDASPLKSRIMLNIDSEEEGYLLTSCAGGAAVTVEIPVKRKGVNGKCADIWIKGLKGGHSGVEIDKGRANSNVLMGRTLYSLSKKFKFNIMTIYGGLKDNAIPRETYSRIIFNENTDMGEVQKHLEELNKIYSNEYASTDAGIKIVVKTENKPGNYSAFYNKSTSKVIAALTSLPNGIQRMSHDIEGLVQTSLNLGKLDTVFLDHDNPVNHRDCPFCVRFSYSLRSSISTEKEELADRIKCLAEALGGTVSLNGDYPAWEYRKDSPLRDLMTEIFEEQYGRKPVIQAIHAGLECGLFAGKLPGLDCISYGPDIKNIHTPQESLDVESVKRTWKYTLEILKRLK